MSLIWMQEVWLPRPRAMSAKICWVLVRSKFLLELYAWAIAFAKVWEPEVVEPTAMLSWFRTWDMWAKKLGRCAAAGSHMHSLNQEQEMHYSILQIGTALRTLGPCKCLSVKSAAVIALQRLCTYVLTCLSQCGSYSIGVWARWQSSGKSSGIRIWAKGTRACCRTCLRITPGVIAKLLQDPISCKAGTSDGFFCFKLQNLLVLQMQVLNCSNSWAPCRSGKKESNSGISHCDQAWSWNFQQCKRITNPKILLNEHCCYLEAQTERGNCQLIAQSFRISWLQNCACKWFKSRNM